jgi:hypothetical protein
MPPKIKRGNAKKDLLTFAKKTTSKKIKPIEIFKREASLTDREKVLHSVFCKAVGKKASNFNDWNTLFTNQTFLAMKELLYWFNKEWKRIKTYHYKTYLRYINYFATFAWLVKEFKPKDTRKGKKSLKFLAREFNNDVILKILNSEWKKDRKDDGNQWAWDQSMADLKCKNGKLSKFKF